MGGMADTLYFAKCFIRTFAGSRTTMVAGYKAVGAHGMRPFESAVKHNNRIKYGLNHETITTSN